MKIIHIADIHIHNSTKRYEEYEKVFQQFYDLIETEKPDKVVISGDLFEDFVEITNEAKTFAGIFLRNIAQKSKVIITSGNHDIMKRNLKRKASTESLTDIMSHKNITYLGKSGFFEDEDLDIIWVNYSHLEKNIIPWKDIKHTKDETKTYIGLFHDPVYGCKLPNGTELKRKSLINLKSFENNDITMMGDIHIRTHYDNNVSYSGSLIQQNFGELPYGHGGIIWEIGKEITKRDFDLNNETVYINYKLKEPNYDNLDALNPDKTYLKSDNNIKIEWIDYSHNATKENEQKIREFFSKETGCDIQDIKFKKIFLNSTISSSKQLKESVNLNDKKQLQEIFEDYLKENKYPEEKIKEILELDDEITERLELNEIEKDSNWEIEEIEIDNFKCYDKGKINWKNKNGIYLIDGENQHGKTTLLDAICYILYGTTLSTNKLGGAQREKNADNRYINNKRDLDYTNGSIILNSGSSKFYIKRETIRTKKKNGEIKSVSTNVDFYEGKISEETKLTGERKTNTQKELDKIIGDFEDFIRLSLTNSENLNNLLSMERATFIDSIIRDAGYDIFEKKVDIFKEYKKEKSLDKINLDVNQEKEKIEVFEKNIEEYSEKIKTIESEISSLKDSKVKKENEKTNLLKKLKTIDKEIINLNIPELNDKILKYKEVVMENNEKIVKNKSSMENLKSEYDEEKLEKDYLKIKKLKDDNTDLKLDISELENKTNNEKNNIEKVDSKIETLKEKEISKIENKIEKLEGEIEELKKEFKRECEKEKERIKNLIKDEEFSIKSINSELSNIKKEGKRIKTEIKEIEEDVICSQCGREYDETHKEHKDNKISSLKEELENLMVPVKKNIGEIKQKESKIEELNLTIEKIDSKEYNKYLEDKLKETKQDVLIKKETISDLEHICEKIKEGDLTDSPELVSKIEDGLKLKEKSLLKIKEFKEEILENNNSISNNKKIIEDLEKSVFLLEKDREEAKNWNFFNNEIKELKLKNENIKLNIENLNSKIELYNNQVQSIEWNKEIEGSIKEVDSSLDSLSDEITDSEEILLENKELLLENKKDLNTIEEKLKKWEKSIKQEELFKEYSKIISRDGIPTYLLKQSINLINTQLDSYLVDVDFTVYFDDELKLKLSPKNRLDISQNAICSSGKERTFIALALKMALRTVNNKPKSNFMMLDEVMGKLKNNSVDEFLDMIKELKNTIDKILIIEPNHNIDYDYIIKVKKDKKGISSFEFN